jgi:hypothetical protein
MRRAKLVLAAAAVMVAMLVAFAAPAMANDKNERNDQHRFSNIFDDNHRKGFLDDNCCRGHDGDFRFHDGDFGFHDGDHFSDFSPFFSPFFALGCWEWSWVFEEWEWEEDCF